MVPIIVGAAIAAGAVAAVKNKSADKTDKHAETTRREIPESEVPPDVLEILNDEVYLDYNVDEYKKVYYDLNVNEHKNFKKNVKKKQFIK